MELISAQLVEVQAELDGKPVLPAPFRASSVSEAMEQLERLFVDRQHASFSVSIRSASGQSWSMATPRLQVALYFVLSALERELVLGE